MCHFELWGRPVDSEVEEGIVFEKYLDPIVRARVRLEEKRAPVGRFEIKDSVVTAYPPPHYDQNLAVKVPLREDVEPDEALSALDWQGERDSNPRERFWRAPA